jgi:hypothetical protein
MMRSDLGQSLVFLARAACRRLAVRLGRLGYRPERRYMRGPSQGGPVRAAGR